MIDWDLIFRVGVGVVSGVFLTIVGLGIRNAYRKPK